MEGDYFFTRDEVIDLVGDQSLMATLDAMDDREAAFASRIGDPAVRSVLEHRLGDGLRAAAAAGTGYEAPTGAYRALIARFVAEADQARAAASERRRRRLPFRAVRWGSNGLS